MHRLPPILLVLLLGGCTTDEGAGQPPPRPRVEAGAPSSATAPAPPPAPSPSASPPVEAANVSTAVGAVRHLAGRIGPRTATGPAYRRAARWVSGRLGRLGYTVRLQEVRVPGGVSWGVPVPAGTSVNVVAVPPGVSLTSPHLVVGAHLDTVPQAPGAEDNASGVGVLLTVAEAVAGRRTRLPVVFVAFGAEEPRGGTDADHHYGSRAYVDRLGPARREAVRGMVSLDRVGVGTVLPVCSAGAGPDRLRAEAAPRRPTGRGASTELLGQPGQRPLVVRAAGPGRGPARQHPVRGLPLPRRRSRRGEPAPAAAGRAHRDRLGQPAALNGPPLFSHTSPRISAPARPATTRGAKPAPIR